MLRLITPVTLVWRRELAADAADIVSGSVGATQQSDDSTALALDTVDITEGQWVTLTADGNATLTTAPTRLAYPVFAGGDRLDVSATEGVTVLYGKFIGETDQFDNTTGVTYAAGTQLMVTTGGLLTPVTGTNPVVAVAEGPLTAATTRFPNGLLRFAYV